MKKSTKRNYIIEIFILIFIITLIFLSNTSPHLVMHVSLFFWLILAILIIIIGGVPRNKNYLNKISCRYVIISLLSYLLITTLLGVFTGFLKNVHSLTFLSIIKNIVPVMILLISKEIVRYLLCKNTSNNKELVVITILYILYEIVLKNCGNTLSGVLQWFTFISLVCLPAIARESLFTYMSTKISFLPTIIYVLAFELTVYVLPIFPDLGNYLNSLIGLMFPYIVYRQISKFVKYNTKSELNFKKHFNLLFLLPIIIFLIVIVILISGIFTYKMIAIGSDSMNPVYYRGDAVIYKKVEIDEIKEKDILVFDNNGAIITHRVKKVVMDGKKIYFQTKGDNNENVDAVLIESDDVYGVVQYVVKYIGYPTILLQELF